MNLAPRVTVRDDRRLAEFMATTRCPRRFVGGGRLFAIILGLLGAAGTRVEAATFTVINTNDSGAGSLRQAVLDANTNPGADTIVFAIPGSGVQTISPLSRLPYLTDDAGVMIDGYSQPGAAPNTLPAGENARIQIELDCSLIGPGPGLRGCLYITSSNNRIQGLSIHGSILPQIWISGAADNVVAGNFIGTDPTGTRGYPTSDGVLIWDGAAANRVGGSLPADRNLISGNRALAVEIGVSAGDGNVVEGNLIGLAADGRTPLPNNRGILIYSSSNRIGGPSPGQGNVISASTSHGLTISGLTIGGSDNVVQGNLIGTDSLGQVAVPNRGFGVILLEGAAANIVGGPSPGAGNVISGNFLGGILLFDSERETTGNIIQGNRIGTDAAGSHPIPNLGFGGLFVFGGVTNTQIGGSGPGAGNIIAYNSGPGIALAAANSGLPVACTVRGNAIYGNTGLGIDLGNDGVTPNDACDGDIGPNNLQNFPVLASAVAELDGLTIRGTLNGAAAATFTVDFYSNSMCDPSGFGQGEQFLGSTEVTTDASCEGSFEATLLVAVAAGSFVTATATDAVGNTSEFSACRQVAGLTVTALSPARIWIGLKNSDDVGTRFDLKAEVLKNGSVIGSGEVDNIPGSGSGFNRALLDQIPLTLIAPTGFSPGDTLSIRLSVRAGAAGHRSGTARLWFNDAAADSRFGATIDGETVGLYLLDGLALGTSPGAGPKRTADVFVDRAAGGNPFKLLGIWSRMF
jgi:hypothetical protein